MKVLEVVGCRSSVAWALMAKAKRGFDSPVNWVFFIFYLCFSLDPFKWESFNPDFMNCQNLIIVMTTPFLFTNYTPLWRGEVFPVDTEKVFWRHIIGDWLSMRLQQTVLLNSISDSLGSCGVYRRSVARALVATARGHGFDSLATTEIFFTFYLCFSLVKRLKFIYLFLIAWLHSQWFCLKHIVINNILTPM